MPQKPRFISTPPRGRTRKVLDEAREEVYERDDYECQYCGQEKSQSELTLEHIAPVSDRGIDDLANFITACRRCNSSKQDKPLPEFLEDRDIEIADLPIHGDIILDTPELPQQYRQARREGYRVVRAEGKLTGGDAYQALEKEFRTQLWETEYGKTLSRRYPRLPGHARASIPLVEYLVPDTRKPIHGVLFELTKSAETRRLIDEMVRTVSNSGDSSEVRDGISQVIEDAESGAEGLQSRVERAFERANVDSVEEWLFSVPDELSDVPVAHRDLLTVEIEETSGDAGVAFIEGYEIRVTYASVGQEVDIRIQHAHGEYADAILLSEQYHPPALL